MFVTRSRVIRAMILREMTTRYGRSAGGYFWAIVTPVAYIAILSVIFSQIVRDPPLGRTFLLFFATGVITFGVYRDAANVVSNAFTFNKPLFNYPQVTLIDSIIARLTLQVITQIVVAILVFGGIFLFSREAFALDLGIIMAATLMATFAGLSIGTLNSVLFVIYPTWHSLWQIITRPLFLISGVFFTPESLPPAIREILLINPIVHIIGLMRRGFYPTYSADYVNFPYVLFMCSATFVIGLLAVYKFQGSLIER